MNPLRHLLLVLALVFAQLAAGAHAIEHVAQEGKGLPQHVCELCLAGYDLGSSLPSVAALPAAGWASVLVDIRLPSDRAALPAPLARQRGPPLA